ncbi:conserved hypothetical protein [Pediculus humanus corporis]|uniref:Uncharacterized protein n=1 Tax=Pediculus humanus subsp. corporis TaxID=121224 RepID=E0VZ77_PEDHC|nr:uncharacterized protein Phum_PHUM527890 [Pediculus humanus corporis]EEB18683.1 conserved hypothetical protein [Pediculus humanus corporis]
MVQIPSKTNRIWKKIQEWLFQQRFQDWIKWVVVGICLLIVYIQLVECCYKLKNPPITSHSILSLNDSLFYPAVTICREPPYNKEVFPKFNFPVDHIGSFPYSSFWKNYPYDIYNISDFWNEAVYDQSVLSSCGLDRKNVNITSSLHLKNGMCHTIKPIFPVQSVGRRSGYSLFLTHDLQDYKPLVDEEPGWKIYIHEPREKFSENINLMSSRQDHVFVPVGEITEVSIDAYQFNVLRNCSDEENYSVTECEENCTINEDIKPNVPCTGPWFPNLDKRLCNNYEEMRTLLKAAFGIKYKNCCKKNCKTTHYKLFVVKRTPCPEERKLSSTAIIYFSSKTVITLEERYSYNWSDFLGEIGGTVGFLLGLSIIGAIDIISDAFKNYHHNKNQ